MSETIEILAIKRIDDDRRVCHVRIGDITIRSLWLVGLAAGKPRISWPETGKGYPIVEAEPGLKSRIDQLVFEHAGIETCVVGGTTRPAAVPAPRRPTPRPKKRPRTAPPKPPPGYVPEFDDPLGDILGGTS